MIAKAISSGSGGGGGACTEYLTLGKSSERVYENGVAQTRADLVAHWSGAVANDATAALEIGNWGKGHGDDTTWRHYVLSTQKGENFSEVQARESVDAMLRSLGAEKDHAYKAAMHFDADTGRYHTHVVLSAVNQETGKLLDVKYDYAKLARAAEWNELEHGLRVDKHMDWRKTLGERDLSSDIDRTNKLEAENALRYSWKEVAKEAVPAVENARSWADVHAALKPYGNSIHAVNSGEKSGFVVRGPERGQAVKASELGLSARELRERLGPYEAPVQTQTVTEQKAEANEIAFQQKLDFITAHPEAVVDRLAQANATWTMDQAGRQICSDVGIAYADRSKYKDMLRPALEAVVDSSQDLTNGKYQVFSTAQNMAEERALFDSARALAQRQNGPSVREPGQRLDEQQKAAYEHLTGPSALSIVSGTAGSGKSTLHNDLMSAYQDEGYRVVACAVTGKAAVELSEASGVQAKTVAKLLQDLNPGHDGMYGEVLTAKTVLVIDEGSLIGTKDLRTLLEHAEKAGSLVRITGDDRQHESVVRGSPVRGLAEEFGSYDMAKTRRADTPELRAIVEDLRAGHIADAFGSMREQGMLAAYSTTDEAKDALVRGYAESQRAGRSSVLVAVSNRDVDDLNARAREELRRDFLGEEKMYQTAYGEKPFAVGDIVTAKQPNLDAGKSVNGDLFHVVGHREDGRLDLERHRDGMKVAWSVDEKPMINYAYASTSYAAQSRSVDDVYALACNDRRSAYVEVSRALGTVTMAYGSDQFRDFNALMFRAQNDYHKGLVRDVPLSVSADELREGLERVARGQEKGFDMTERRSAFHIVNGLEHLEKDEMLTVARDPHSLLKDPSHIFEQASERELAQEQERCHSRGLSMSR